MKKTYDRPDSPMHGWPVQRRMDPWAFPLLEVICPHGVGHPMPESVETLERTGKRGHWGVHGCDGCCLAAQAPRVLGTVEVPVD